MIICLMLALTLEIKFSDGLTKKRSSTMKIFGYLVKVWEVTQAENFSTSLHAIQVIFNECASKDWQVPCTNLVSTTNLDINSKINLLKATILIVLYKSYYVIVKWRDIYWLKDFLCWVGYLTWKSVFEIFYLELNTDLCFHWENFPNENHWWDTV